MSCTAWTRQGKFMNKTLLFLVVLCLLPFLTAGCAVKKHDATEDGTVSSGPSVFPSGMSETDHGKLLAYLPTSPLTPYKWNTVDFHFSTLDLTPLDSPDYDFTVNYMMPDMPAMHIDAPTWKVTAPGVLEATLNISMPGDWKVWVTVSQHGAAIDTFTHVFSVPFTTR